jgi:membrane protein implicated in regulation of membrane protease activity
MTLKRLLVTLLVLWLGLIGIVCGFLCLACLLLVLFWQGLGVSTLILALACLTCLGLALLLAGRKSYEGLGDRQARQDSLMGRVGKALNPFDRSSKKGQLDEEWQKENSELEDWLRRSSEKL